MSGPTYRAFLPRKRNQPLVRCSFYVGCFFLGFRKVQSLAPGAAAEALGICVFLFAGSVFRCGCGFSPCVTGLTGLLWRFVYGSNSPRLVGLPCVALLF